MAPPQGIKGMKEQGRGSSLCQSDGQDSCQGFLSLLWVLGMRGFPGQKRAECVRSSGMCVCDVYGHHSI